MYLEVFIKRCIVFCIVYCGNSKKLYIILHCVLKLVSITMAPTDEELDAESAAFHQRMTQLQQIGDVQERLKELEEDERKRKEKYMARCEMFNLTIKTPENTDLFLKTMLYVYHNVWQSEEYLEDAQQSKI